MNTLARQHIARCLGVRFSSAELARLRAVRVMLDPLCEPREDAHRAHASFNSSYRQWRSRGLSSPGAMAAARRDQEAYERSSGRTSVASATAALCKAYADHDREDRGLGGPGGLWFEKGV